MVGAGVAAGNDAAVASSTEIQNGVNDHAQGFATDAQTATSSPLGDTAPAGRPEAAPSGSRAHESDITPQVGEGQREQGQPDSDASNAPQEADVEATSHDGEPQLGLEEQPGNGSVLEIDVSTP